VIARYLATMQDHHWEAMGSCLSTEVVRVGPYGDTYRGRPEYVAFLAALLPSLPGYSMEVERITCSPDGRVGVAELSETVEVDGSPLKTPEALVFDMDDDGLIARIRIYIQTAPPRGSQRPRTN
jgi:SnoaL-like domain